MKEINGDEYESFPNIELQLYLDCYGCNCYFLSCMYMCHTSSERSRLCQLTYDDASLPMMMAMAEGDVDIKSYASLSKNKEINLS